MIMILIIIFLNRKDARRNELRRRDEWPSREPLKTREEKPKK